MLGASCLESIGCAGRGGQNLHCMEVADKMLTTFGLWVKITDFAGWCRQNIHSRIFADNILIRCGLFGILKCSGATKTTTEILAAPE
jgi:hypothetical protein